LKKSKTKVKRLQPKVELKVELKSSKTKVKNLPRCRR